MLRCTMEIKTAIIDTMDENRFGKLCEIICLRVSASLV